MAQSRFEPGSTVYGLWQGDKPVGLMAVIDLREHDLIDEGMNPNGAYLWRFMIDEAFQGQGLGRQGLQLFEDWARSQGLYTLQLSFVPENHAAESLYQSVGYRRTGHIVDGEPLMQKVLSPDA